MHNAPHAVETRRRISVALTGRKQSPEAVAKRAASNTGKKRSPETVARMRVARLLSGYAASDATREKMSAAKTGTRRSKEAKAAVSRGALNGGVEKRMLTNLERYGRADGTKSGTRIEREAERVLRDLGVTYALQTIFCGAAVDFLLESHRLVIELDGCYFHGCPDCRLNIPKGLDRIKSREAAVAARIAAKGFRLVRVWEHDIDRFKSIIAPVLEEISASNRKT